MMLVGRWSFYEAWLLLLQIICCISLHIFNVLPMLMLIMILLPG